MIEPIFYDPARGPVSMNTAPKRPLWGNWVDENSKAVLIAIPVPGMSEDLPGGGMLEFERKGRAVAPNGRAEMFASEETARMVGEKYGSVMKYHDERVKEG